MPATKPSTERATEPAPSRRPRRFARWFAAAAVLLGGFSMTMPAGAESGAHRLPPPPPAIELPDLGDPA